MRACMHSGVEPGLDENKEIRVWKELTSKYIEPAVLLGCQVGSSLTCLSCRLSHQSFLASRSSFS
ncbi:unnamed protein product [Dovyalis caffra]|uniref:Uncharacterized protein n=1 Tax=Dovyalis caffra TaxID=77055 RepID=A0AAV1SD05_9ROSI|nr:unnamed protein product [Dovyalis caffra]